MFELNIGLLPTSIILFETSSKCEILLVNFTRSVQERQKSDFDLIINTLKTEGNKDVVDVLLTPEYKAQIERRKNYKLYTYELDMFVRWKYQKPVPKKVLLSNKHYNSDYYYMIKDQIVPTLPMFNQLKEIF